jgi:hypothetical protein
MRSQPVRLVAGAAVTDDRRGQSQLSNMGALSANAARRNKPAASTIAQSSPGRVRRSGLNPVGGRARIGIVRRTLPSISDTAHLAVRSLACNGNVFLCSDRKLNWKRRRGGAGSAMRAVS